MRVLVTAIALAFSVTTAVADDKDAAGNEAKALQHLDRGVAAYKAGDFRGAHRELLIANRLVPDRANPYRWLALTEIQLGDCASALPNIEAFLARVAAEDPRVPEMTRWRELCSRTGVLRVETTPPRATLRLDGAIVGASPYRSLSIRAGNHELVGELPGYAVAKRSIVVEAGRELDVHLTLPRAERSVTDRWWFWPSVGGVALVVAGGVVFAATRGDDDTLLPPVQCDATGCRP